MTDREDSATHTAGPAITNVLDEDRMENLELSLPLIAEVPPEKPKNLTELFDHVFVINCAHRPDRLAEFRTEILSKGLADLDKITVMPAIIGDYTTHPAGWGGGNGAWGCILPGNRVQGRIRTSSKARYAGDAVRLVTRSGASVTMTVNHPVLTEQGFVRAGELHQGVNLLRYSGGIKPGAAQDNVENKPPTVREVFDALVSNGLPIRRKSRSPLDFYGDGKSLHGEIEIVDVDGDLPLPGVWPHAQRTKHDVLLRRHKDMTSPLSHFGPTKVCRSHLLSTPFRAGTLIPPLLTVGLAAAELNPAATQHPSDTGSGRVALARSLTGAVGERTPEVVNGFSGEVTPYDLSFLGGGENALVGQFGGGGPVAQFDPICGEVASDRVAVEAAAVAEDFQGLSRLVALPELTQQRIGKFTGSGRFYGIGSAADLATCFDKEAFSDVRAEVELARELLDGGSSVVELDELIAVERFHYDGDVLDFGTTCGHFTVSGSSCQGESGLIVSNCLQSHRRIMEDLMHIRDERGDIGWDNALILEDDVFFLDNALADLNEFMRNVPEGWGQLYLGGQHRGHRPLPLSNTVLVGHSVNRTHAYAVSRQFIQKIYCHVSYMMDYHGTNKHIDHQLEVAHQRKDWPVYCPTKWICGQRAGTSNISGKAAGDMVWQP